MAPTQARTPFASSIWSPLTSPNPIMESLINNNTNSWTFASEDFWQAPYRKRGLFGGTQHGSSSKSDYDQLLDSAAKLLIDSNKLSIDLDGLLADSEDLSKRRSPNGRLLNESLPINRFPNPRLPTFRGLSGSSTDVSPSSSVGVQVSSSTQKEYDAYYESFDQVDVSSTWITFVPIELY